MSIINGVYNNLNFVELQRQQNQLLELKKSIPIGEQNSIISDGCVIVENKFSITNEDEYEFLPYHHKDSNVVIAGDFRLFNRCELLQLLGIEDSTQLTDSYIVLNLYLKFGNEFAKLLLGEYNVIIYNARAKELVLVTDHTNSRPLFYFQDTEKVVFSSHLEALKKSTLLETSINLKKIASLQLTLLNNDNCETYFNNIYYLPGSTITIFDAYGNKNTKKHWEITLPKLRFFKSEDEFTDEFQSIFKRVVTDHCRSSKNICSLLSGGLDSSSITAMAAQTLFKDNHRSLYSLSAVLPHDNTTDRDESYFINLLKFENLHKEFINDSLIGPFDSLCNITLHPAYTSRHYLYKAFSDRAHNLNSNIILDGGFGEFGPTYWADERLTEMLHSYQIKELISNAIDHKKLYSRSWKSILYHDLIRPSLPLKLQALIRGKKTITLSNNLDLIRPEFRSAHLTEEYITSLKKYNRNLSDIRHSFDARFNCFNIIDKVLLNKEPNPLKPPQLNVYQEARYSYPFLDSRLLEFCLSAPNELRFKNGYRRYIIRVGMKGLIPNEIRYRTTKEPFSPDYMHRFHRQIGIARDAMESFKGNSLVSEILDIPRLENYLDLKMTSNKCYTKNDFIGMHTIPNAIYLGSFIINNT